MDCPICGAPMQPGHIRCGRDKPVWYGDGENISGLDRSLGGIGQLTAVERTWLTIKLPGHYCSACRKLIVETEFIK